MAGNFSIAESAAAQGLRMAAEGARIIDIGGESTRPGADEVSEEEEVRRVLPVIEETSRSGEATLLISIDTSKASVARPSDRSGRGHH